MPIVQDGSATFAFVAVEIAALLKGEAKQHINCGDVEVIERVIDDFLRAPIRRIGRDTLDSWRDFA